MDQEELYKELKSLGLPLAYNKFTEEVKPPYIAYLFSYSDDFIADNSNYKSVANFEIELYTENKALQTEKLIEDKLKELEIPYGKLETWIESESLFQILYSVQII